MIINKLYPLTNVQNSILLTEQYYNYTNIGNVGGILSIEEPVDLSKLNEAINHFIKLNDSFRLRFKQENQTIYQYVQDFEFQNFEILELDNISDFELLRSTFRNTHFDIFNDSLYKFILYKLPDGRGGYLHSSHHLISDAWNMGLLASQSINFYTDLCNGESLEIPDVKNSYFDYMQSEQHYLNSDVFKKNKDFWNSYIEEIPDLPSLLPNKTSEHTFDLSSKRLEFVLSEEETSRIVDFCRAHNITPFVLFYTSFALYLSRVNNTNNIILGTPLLNRCNHREKNTTGLYITTLPTKFNFTTGLIMDSLHSISADLKQIFRHQKYPSSYIINDLKNKTNSSGKLFNMIFSYQNTRDNSRDSQIKYHVEWVYNAKSVEDLDIHIYDFDNTGKLQIYYDFLLSIYDDKTINDLHKRYINIIKQIISNPNISHDELDIVTPAEKNEILNIINNTSTIYPKDKSINQLFEESAEFFPDRVALKDKYSILTYDELNSKSNQYARKLIEEGVKKGDCIALLMNKSIDIYILIIAIIKAGAVFVPIDLEAPLERITSILEDCNPKFIFSDKNLIGSISDDFKERILSIDDESLSNLRKTNLSNINKPNDPLYIMYTSGSTGKPKGVVVPHIAVNRLVKNTNFIKFQKDDILVQSSTIAFDASTLEIWGALLNGLPMYILAKEDFINPILFEKTLKDEKITIIFLTVAIFDKFADINPKMFENLRILLVGGDALTPKTIYNVKNVCPELIILNGYGPTENTTFSTYLNVKNYYPMNIPIGTPLANSTAYILNRFGTLQPTMIPGELVVGGDGLSLGYLNNESYNSEKFIIHTLYDLGRIYKTGDLAYYNDDSNIVFVGRFDNQVKIRGFRVELSEIENLIRSYKEVRDCVVLVNITENKKSIYAYIIKNNKFVVESLEEFLNNSLPSYMIPSEYIFMDSFPLTLNGKLDRKKIALIKPQSNNKRIVLPSNEVESNIYSTISTNCNKKDFSVTDDFITDLNLDSLDIMSLVPKLNQYSLTIQNFNDYPSVKKLANYISTYVNTNTLNNDDIVDSIYNTEVEIPTNFTSFDLSKVLLTGVTGFLGSHIMYELLENNAVKEIYCIIRNTATKLAKDRFHDICKLYFPNINADLIKSKVKILTGDLEKENLGIADVMYNTLKSEITTVIHSAALVKHYGKYEHFYNINVVGTQKIVDFCIDSANAKLAYISTLSVGGFSHISSNQNLSENSLMVNQLFQDNVYMKTKFEAEVLVLKLISEKKLDCRIFRLGNIMPRISDGLFQKNMLENAFICRLNTLFNYKIITQLLQQYTVDLSPVDLCANSILSILETDTDQVIFHISNSNKINLSTLLEFSGISFDLVENEDFIDIISMNSTNPLDTLILDSISQTNYIETITNNDLTINFLNNINFKWNLIDKSYINQILKLLGVNK